MPDSHFVVRHAGEGDTLSVAGDLYRFLAEGQDTGGRCFFCHGLILPGGGSPPHVHLQDSEAFYVLKGVMTFYTLDDGASVQAGPGTFVHLPEGRPHRFGNESGQDVEMLIWASSPALGRMFREVGRASDVPVPPTPEDIEALVEVAPKYGITLLT